MASLFLKTNDKNEIKNIRKKALAHSKKISVINGLNSHPEKLLHKNQIKHTDMAADKLVKIKKIIVIFSQNSTLQTFQTKINTIRNNIGVRE